MSRSDGPAVNAAYFDGHSSRRQSCTLHADARHLTLVHADGRSAQLPWSQITVSEPQGRAPRTLRLPGEDYCEVAQGAALDALLAAGGKRNSMVVRAQHRWRGALLALASVALVMMAAYQYALPAVAAWSAPRVPAGFSQQLSDELLSQLDEHKITRPSTLPASRQRVLREAFSEWAADAPRLRLHFRSAPGIGPNAFALPDGQIVVFDELIALARNDVDVLAVLAHEAGHVHHHHGLRQAIQSSVIGLVVGAWLGDVSSVLSGLTSVLLTSNYSREFESEADAYALRLLAKRGLDGEPMAFMLAALEKAHRHGNNGSGGGNDLLDSHPNTRDRIKSLTGPR